MICMLCDHAANTTGWFLGGFASFRVSVYTICLYASVFKAPPTDFLCSAPEIEASPVNEPEPSSHFLGRVGRQTKQPPRIFFPWLWSGEDPLGPAAVCSATGITRGLWSHRTAARFAGKERDDVMLFARRHQRALIWCAMEERRGWESSAIITPQLWFYEASSSLS